MTARRFTGERLHEGDARFAVDLARHRAAYELAAAEAQERPGARILDLGCGSGYGSARLAQGGARVFAIDRVAPDARHRGAARFVLGDLRALPLRPRSFGVVVSFQVIEHLADPSPYLAAIQGLLRPDGLAILTTPNRLTSDGVNPYHLHEYTHDELAGLLSQHFAQVEMQGVGMSDPVRAYMRARSERIARILRLDPLRLRERLPRALIEWLFALFARLVRRGPSARPDASASVSWRDFPVGAPSRGDIDLVALCRRPHELGTRDSPVLS